MDVSTVIRDMTDQDVDDPKEYLNWLALEGVDVLKEYQQLKAGQNVIDARVAQFIAENDASLFIETFVDSDGVKFSAHIHNCLDDLRTISSDIVQGKSLLDVTQKLAQELEKFTI
jgi:hypothetical protein